MAGALFWAADHRSRHELEKQRHLLQEAIAIGLANPSTISQRDLYAARILLVQVLLRQGSVAEAEQGLARAQSLKPFADLAGHEPMSLLAAQKRDFPAALRLADPPNAQLWVRLREAMRLACYRAETGQVASAVATVRAELPKLLTYQDEGFLSEPLSNAAHIMICAKRYRDAER